MTLRILLVLLFLTGASEAHDPGFSDSHIVVRSDTIDVALRIDAGGHRDAAEDLGAEPIRLTIDGRQLASTGATKTRPGEYVARFHREAGQQLRIELRVFDTLGKGHKHYVRVDVEDPGDSFEAIVSADRPDITVRLPERNHPISTNAIRVPE